MEGTAESGSAGAPTQEMAKAEEVDLRGYTGNDREKCLAFLRWQIDRQNVEKCKEYVDFCKKMRREARGDKEK